MFLNVIILSKMKLEEQYNTHIILSPRSSLNHIKGNKLTDKQTDIPFIVFLHFFSVLSFFEVYFLISFMM